MLTLPLCLCLLLSGDFHLIPMLLLCGFLLLFAVLLLFNEDLKRSLVLFFLVLLVNLYAVNAKNVSHDLLVHGLHFIDTW